MDMERFLLKEHIGFVLRAPLELATASFRLFSALQKTSMGGARGGASDKMGLRRQKGKKSDLS